MFDRSDEVRMLGRDTQAVSPCQPRERYAAGGYPNQHPAAPACRRTPAPTDPSPTPMSWCGTFEAHHVVRPEDWR
jgi:primary-amine oxidase